ncbi:trans-Golgi network-localized SYP41-interacting protein 1 isoform X2 [Lycium ferocissimum]|uniref:trans-Golgi network-localized SYP41-interacting protein 1 isoform X2 n=1 Tax=Lycium ferocissimum TaxID=112874 RepID=UPI00281549AB|nr:trans-Golgi network-localized SYP41-interacting protein 1 isoform X2 [Lycium ferocissimum]
MDKNKGRTDLLAAGRKKLQQFRQKKDGKGGKSSKASKSAGDATPDLVDVTAKSNQVPDGEKPLHIGDGAPTSSELLTKEDLPTTNAEAPTLDESINVDIVKTAPTSGKLVKEDAGELEAALNSDSGDRGIVNSSSISEHANAKMVNEDVKEGHLEAPGIIASDVSTKSSPTDVPLEFSSYSSADDAVSHQVEVERLHAQEQVTDVGTMQESHDSGSKKGDSSTEVEIEGDKKLPLDEPSENSISQTATLVGDVGKEETKAEYIQLSEPNNVPSTVLATQNAKIAEDRGHPMEDAVSGSRKEEKLEMPSASGEYENHKDEVQISDSRDIVSENSVENKMVNISSGSDASYISLCQLAEVVRDLDEDDFRFLFMCRDSAPNEPSLKLFDTFEKLKEQLYLASLVKDVSCLQLAEESELQMKLSCQHQKLTDQISEAKASSTELGEKNDILADQLAQSRSEFQLIVSERDDFQKQLHISKGEVGELSERINELQTKLETSLGENASLSSEMVDCRNLVATLQVRNESLIGSLNLLSEENKKLLEEKENLVLENEKLGTDLAQSKALFGSLQLDNEELSQNFTSLREEKMELHGEKERLISENGKLIAQLLDYKNVVEALQVENKNINESLISVTEAKKQLQEEKKSVLGETEKLGLEFKESESLIEALQMELAEAKGHLTSVMEERNELEEQKKYLLSETEKQSFQLAKYENSCSKVDDDLKDASLRIEHLTKENMHLKRSLELSETMKTESPNQSSFAYQSEEEAGHQLEGSCHSSFASANRIGDDCSNWFGVMKRHMEEAERVLEELEKAVEDMHSRSASMSRSSGKAVSPGVSKLIQAFESKDHDDEHQPEEFQSSENQIDADIVQIQGLTKTLRALLKDLVLGAGNGYQFLEGEKSSKTATEVAAEELRAKCESLNEHIDLLEGANIELMVFNESLGGCFWNAKEREEELMVQNEALHKQEVTTKAENSKLRENLSSFQEKLSILQNQLGEMRESSKEVGSCISNQVEALYKEVADRVSILQEEWNSIIDQVFQTLNRLDLSVEAVGSSSPSRVDHGLGCINLSSCTAASIDAAINVIEALQGQVEAARRESMLSTGVNEKLDFLQVENQKSVGLLHKIYGNLKKLVNEMPGHLQVAEVDDPEKSVDLSHPGAFDSLLEQLQRFLDEKTQVESVNEKLKSELMARATEFEELSKRSVGSDSILKMVQVVEGVISLDSFEINITEPVSCLESLTFLLVQKYKEATEDVRLSREEYASKEAQVIDLQGQMDHLSLLLAQCENEVVVLRESLKGAEEDVVSIRSQYQEKVAEFEQSEQRVSALREKLGIAVTKGKGLIVQRDSLKQSLADTSSELQKCSEELQLKDARLQEVEMKLKTYSEAGERMEALESELSYIRNSATALRESFLLKDSVLQKIEEIVEDLELPDHFHAKDIIDKVDWLAKSVAGNSLPLTDWDHKSSVGGSYSDAGYALADGWKEASQPNLGSSEDLRRRFEELQGKFYGLAEQNEMLEQSLMERNNLVLKWEEMLDRIDMPSHLRSLEPEDRIGWLVLAVSEAQNQYDSLQQKYDNFESLFASTNAELEESHRKISELENAYQFVLSEKELLLKSVESLNFDYEEMSRKAAQSEISNDDLQNRVGDLQKKLNETNAELEKSHRKISELENAYQLVISEKKLLLKSVESLNFDYEEMSRKAAQSEISNDDLQSRVGDLQKKLNEMLGAEERIHHLEGEIRRLEDMVKDFLRTSQTDDVLFSTGSSESLEQLIRKLIDKYTTLSLGKPSESDTTLEHVDKRSDLSHEEKRESNVSCDENADGGALSRKLEDALSDLLSLKEEKESIALNNQSLVRELDELGIKNKELQDRLSQEEQKSSSLREKLNVAVRKGKSLLQHRDSLKQLIEELNGEVERLKAEIRLQENAISDHEQRIKDLSAYPERIKTVESESSILRDQLAEKDYTLSMILSTLEEINVGPNISNPVEKLKGVGQLCHDLQSALTSSEHEARKSKRAAELLLAELNEVQERNDGLQEELAKSLSELSGLSKQKESAEVAKHEALAHLEKLSSTHSEERKNQLAEITMLKSGVDQLREDLFVVDRLLNDVLSMDLETMHHLGSSMKVCLEQTDQNHFPLPVADSSGLAFAVPESKVFNKEIDSINQKLNRHSHLLHEEAARITEILRTIHEEIFYHKQHSNSLKTDVMRLESIQKEKDAELLMVQRCNSMLYEACTTLVLEIESRKSQLVGNSVASGASRINSVYQSLVEGNDLAEKPDRFSEEGIRSVIERLFMAVKDIMSVQSDIAEFGQKDLKAAISNLQKELQEKDIQREKICAELVSQIKEAESISKSYSQELQIAKARMDDLHRKVKLMEEERDSLAHRIKELQDQESNFADIQLRVKSLEDMLAAKEQENEALMQALDEEEAQMEDMTNKIEEMERVLLQKNKDMENLEVSRGKTMKKLSVTVSKFDELHQLSESLLSEVENLQSQLQERDTEISFLRQEVTRCTNDAIASAQMSSKRNTDEVHDFLTWVDKLISRVQAHDMNCDDAKVNQIHEYKEMLEKQLVSVISELEDLRALAQTRDSMLRVERDKVEQLVRKEEFLENSLRDKESQLTMLQGASDMGQLANSTSEIIEIEPVANKRAVPGTVASQVRSLRKTNNDQVAVAIDVDPDSGKLDDEDDDKAHGFKSMTTSRIVPRFTRPITDMIDGLWVTCDRTLMRQPVLRLSVIIYWALLHALLATFVV